MAFNKSLQLLWHNFKKTYTSFVMMKIKLTILFILISITWNSFSQEKRIALDGIVRNDSLLLADVTISNHTSTQATTSFGNGRFSIDAKLHDTLIFKALNYINRVVIISQTHMDNKKIIVYLEEGFNQLDEIMLMEKIRLDFGDLSLPKGSILDNDKMSSNSAPNMLNVTDPTRGNSSVNFISLLKGLKNVIWKKRIEEKRQLVKIKAEKITFLDSIAPKYKSFFTTDLNIAPDKIYEFIDYCQDQGLADFYSNDPIEVMNFLVIQSRKFNLIKP